MSEMINGQTVAEEPPSGLLTSSLCSQVQSAGTRGIGEGGVEVRIIFIENYNSALSRWHNRVGWTCSSDSLFGA